MCPAMPGLVMLGDQQSSGWGLLALLVCHQQEHEKHMRMYMSSPNKMADGQKEHKKSWLKTFPRRSLKATQSFQT